MSSPEQLPRALHVAVQTAVSRGGVSVLVLPGDVAAATLVDEGWRSHIAVARPLLRPAEPELREFARLLSATRKDAKRRRTA